MKIQISIILFLILKFATAQDLELENYPFDSLKSKCYSFRETVYYDSIKHRQLNIEVSKVDYEDTCTPAEYKLTKYQFFPWQYHRFVYGICEDPISYYSGGHSVPWECTYWVKLDSGQFVRKVTFHKNGKRNDPGEVTYIDSVLKFNEECISKFYEVENDSVQSDTILSTSNLSLELVRSVTGKAFGIWTCEYFYETKHGKEFCFYSIEEVKSVCVKGKTGLLKYQGKWKYGKKHGKWEYYSIEGNLLRVEKYWKGKLKKSTEY